MIIFEKEKYSQIDNQRPRKNQPFFPNIPSLHQKPGSPCNRYRNHNQPQIGEIPVPVEKEGSDEEEKLGKGIA
jgi:hypothetical protein